MGMTTPINRRLLLAASAAWTLVSCSKPNRESSESAATNSPKLETLTKPDDLVELVTLDQSIRLDMRYATTNNFTGRILYDQPRAFMVRVAAQALARAHKLARADGYGLMIFDAYRPWRVTKQLWDATPPGPKRNYVANPKKGSRHNRGCAVDLTLYRISDGAQIEMPSAYDDFSPKAHRNYADDTPTARRHVKLLEKYMEAADFTGLSNEWWHFDYKDWAEFPILDIPFADI